MSAQERERARNPEPDQPKMTEVELTSLWLTGVLMAANERFFWPYGLALSWEVEGSKVQPGTLRVVEWHNEDNHIESIGTYADDAIAKSRREAFRAWALARIAQMPVDADRIRATKVLDQLLPDALGPSPEPD